VESPGLWQAAGVAHCRTLFQWFVRNTFMTVQSCVTFFILLVCFVLTCTLQWLAPEKLRGCGAILVNSSGKRFVDELTTRDKVTAAIMKQVRCAVLCGVETVVRFCCRSSCAACGSNQQKLGVKSVVHWQWFFRGGV
jgi:hypothetical protein